MSPAQRVDGGDVERPDRRAELLEVDHAVAVGVIDRKRLAHLAIGG